MSSRDVLKFNNVLPSRSKTCFTFRTELPAVRFSWESGRVLPCRVALVHSYHKSFVDPQGAARPRPVLPLRPRLLRVREGTGLSHVGLPGQDGEDEGHDEPRVGHHLPHRLLLRGETGEL